MTNKKHIIGGIFWGCIAAIVVGNLVTNRKTTCGNSDTASITPDRHEPNKDPISYGDAVAAVVNSDMLSAYKQQIISFLDNNMSEDIYKAIICIATDSSMLSSNRCYTIRKICEQHREKNISYNERM